MTGKVDERSIDSCLRELQCRIASLESDAAIGAAVRRVPELFGRPVYSEENPWEDPEIPTHVCLVYSNDPVPTWDVGVWVEEYEVWQVGGNGSLVGAIDAALQRAQEDEETHRVLDEEEEEEGK